MAYAKMIPYIWIPSAPKIYGAEWLGTSDPSWTRTDDAAGLSDPNPAVNNGNGNSPFDTIYPWKDMKRAEDSAAGTLVEIPKFYYKWIRSGAKMKLLITDSFSDGFFVSPAHADRGDGKGERDVAYIGAYHSASDYKSKTGVLPLVNKTRAQFRTGIHNLGSTIWQWDFAMYWTIAMLYLVEYAHWNSQDTIGRGCSDSGSNQNMGSCDSMIYHTGTNASTRTDYGITRYRYIEGLWDNGVNFVDGFYADSTNMYCIKNPMNFSDTSNGVNIGSKTIFTATPSAFSNVTVSGFEYALYPNVDSGDGYTALYTCDGGSFTADGTVLRIGGTAQQNLLRGLFWMLVNTNASYYGESTGSRLMKLP